MLNTPLNIIGFLGAVIAAPILLPIYFILELYRRTLSEE